MNGIIWLVVAVLFAILEASTAQMICIWFAGGALGGLLASVLGLDIWGQSIVFVVVSAILLIATKKLVKSLKKDGFERTNADSQIGKRIVISKRVDNLHETGETLIKGISWSVRSVDDTVLETGEEAIVERIEGVKLIVRKVESLVEVE